MPAFPLVAVFLGQNFAVQTYFTFCKDRPAIVYISVFKIWPSLAEDDLKKMFYKLTHSILTAKKFSFSFVTKFQTYLSIFDEA